MSTLKTTNIAHPSSASNNIVLDSSARVLVGTSSSSSTSLLVVQGYAGVSSGSGEISITRGGTPSAVDQGLGVIRFQNNNGNTGVQIEAVSDGSWTAGSNHRSKLVFSTTADGASSPTERLRISSGGLFTAVSIYNNTTASTANVVIRSDGVFERSTSSAKYKTDVEDLQDPYADAILNCRPIWYRSTCSSDDASHSWWGFLAEEVAAIDPRLVHWKTFDVTYDENGSAVSTPCDPEPDGVAYERFVPHLLNLIKRQKEQIESLEARLTAAGI